jgi:hypothetical protein
MTPDMEQAYVAAGEVAVAILLTICLIPLLNLMRRDRALRWRVVSTVISIVLLLGSPWPIELLIAWLNRAPEISWMSIDRGLARVWSPALVAVLTAARITTRRRPPSKWLPGFLESIPGLSPHPHNY